MIRSLAALAVLTASLALAQTVPGSISFNARLTDTAGMPVTGSHAMSFGLYDQGSGGAAVWTENVAGASFSTEGVAFVELGAVTPLTTSALDGRKLYLEVSVDGTVMAPRLAIVSVPYALRASVAATAGSVGSLTEAAIQRRVTGTCPAGQALRSIDASGGVQCEPVVAALMSCASGEVLKSSGTSWVCAADATGPTYGVTAPIALTGTTLSLSGCPNNQVLKSNGTTWICSDDLQGSAGVTSVSVTPPLMVANPNTTPTLSISQAGATAPGYVSSADWNAFNSKRTSGGRNLIEWVPVTGNWSNTCGTIAVVSLDAVDQREGDSSFQFDVTSVNAAGSCAVYGGFIPVDPGLVYTGRVVSKLVAGTGPFNAGVATYDASRNFIANRYFIASAATLTAGVWTAFEGTITLTGAGQSQFPANTRFVKPLVNPNFNNLGITRVDAFEFFAAERPAAAIARITLDWRNNAGSAAAATWVNVPQRTLTVNKVLSSSHLKLTYQDTLGTAGPDYAGCNWRILVDGAVEAYFSDADMTSAGVWKMSNAAHMAWASGYAVGPHTIQVQNYRSAATGECLMGWNATGSFLSAEEIQ